METKTQNKLINKTLNNTGKNYLFVIGIDDYKYFNPLNNAIKDVEEITDILTNLYQFEEDNIYYLYNQEATIDGIDEKFLELVDLVEENDNLLIFYSGHGYYRENVKEGYWIPVDGRKDKVSDYISNAVLIRYLQNIKAHHLLMIVDSCFSGALVEQLRGDHNTEHFPSRRVFASGRAEMVSDGIPGENSPFAKGMIDFLKANQNKSASTSDMIHSVKQYVKGVSPQLPVEGRLRDSKDNRGEFFFKRKLTEEDLWKNSSNKNSLEAYQNYLKIYPSGKYAAEAQFALKSKIAEKAWKKALANNTIDDFEDYIILYPDSIWVEEAREKIKILTKAIEEAKRIEQDRVERLRKEAKEEKEIDRVRTEFNENAMKSQEAMQKNNYREARVFLRKCEECYREGREGFIVDLEEIKRRRFICKQQLLFEEYSDNGRRAFRIKDYASAIQLFNSALKIEPNNAAIIKLRNAATTLESAKISVEINSRGDRETNAAAANTPPPRQSITVKKNRKSTNHPPRRSSPLKVTRKPKTPIRSTKPMYTYAESLPVEKKTDLTFLWIALLALGWFLLCKLLGFF